jgi:hypothetical protein
VVCVVDGLREFAAGFVGGGGGEVSLQGSVLGLWAGYSVGIGAVNQPSILMLAAASFCTVGGSKTMYMMR